MFHGVKISDVTLDRNHAKHKKNGILHHPWRGQRKIPFDTENRIKINFYPSQNGSDASMLQQSLWKHLSLLV
jgi:DNA mismatch repair protein MutH